MNYNTLSERSTHHQTDHPARLTLPRRRFAKQGRVLMFAALSLLAQSSEAADWWTIPDKDFAEQYAKKATSDTVVDQSEIAWRLFARVNQPKPFGQGKMFSQWELWPSNDDTFSPAVPLFKAENKVRTRPHLQAPKTVKFGAQLFGIHNFLPPTGGGEEVTRNPISYDYITGKHLNTSAGVLNYLTSTTPMVDLPIGAVEIKAAWVQRKVDNAYQVIDSTQTPPVVYSLLGLHIMAKFVATPTAPFSSEEPSWFWTTFEFQGNPGLANAQSLLTYKDALPPANAMSLLSEAGMGDSLFKNYRCNGTQIRYSDAKNKNILLGNTTMENFAFKPANAGPGKWKSWNISCHTCHGTASANPKHANNAPFFFPFPGSPVGKIPATQMTGYQSLDFIWSIPFQAK